MAMKPASTAWDHVLVRHVVPAKRDQVGRLETLLRVSFPGSPTVFYSDEARDLSFLGPPRGRWLLAPGFPGESWVPLFASGASNTALFDANAGSRRLEVAWFGYRPEAEGWFVQVHRAGKSVVQFQQDARPAAGQGSADPAEREFRRICDEFEIARPTRTIRADEREFVVVGAWGKPVKSGLRGYIFYQCPALSAGEYPASDDLARAIERCDPDGIRDAIRRGASLTLEPDTLGSPLASALYRCGRCDAARWKQCLETLLAAGCPIDGRPHDIPPLFDCVRHYIPDANAREMVQFLLTHGANPNATGPRGESPLFEAVVHGRVALVRLLVQHGAVPTQKIPPGISIIDWLRQRIDDPFHSTERSQYAGILRLLEA